MKLKKFISLLASLAMIVTAVTGAMSASAADIVDKGDCGENVTWTLDSDGVLTLSGEGEMASPDIPELSGDFPTGDYSDIYSYKEYKNDIKEVVIEEGITAIGFCAFYQMPNLQTVVLPKTITEFKGGVNTSTGLRYNYAFAECTSLKNLTLSEGMTAIGSCVFQGCTDLESVTIPKSITDWDGYSFYKCSKLKDITLPEGLTIMGAYAFSETAVEHIVIPSTIEIWRKVAKASVYSHDCCAFANCKKLSSVTFNNGIKLISGTLFVGCSSLSRVVIPKSVTSMNYAFENCNGLEEAYIEDGTQILLNGNSSGFQFAFLNCTNLKKLEIPEGVDIDYFNAQWCRDCTSLTDLYIHGKDYGYFSVGNSSSKIHCYSGTETYNSLVKNGVAGSRLADIEEDIENAQAELNKAVTEAEKYAEADYTTESYGALKTALENAKKYDENSTGVLPIEWAADDIMTAIEGLRDKSEEPSSSDPSSSDPSDSSNPTDNSSDPSNSSGNNNQSQSPNTPATPPTAAPTTATPKPVTQPTVTTTAKPAKVKAVKLKAKKKKLNVSWKKVSGATGYEIQYATNNKFTKGKKTVTVKKNKVILKKLKPKKKYFVKVRAYKLANGRKYFGKWSKVVKKKTK